MDLRRLLVQVLLFLALLCCSNAEPLGYGVLDLRESGTLKGIFDGGLRPTRRLGLETLKCEIGRTGLKIVFSDEKSIDIEIERGVFSIDGEYRVSSAQLYGIERSVSGTVDDIIRVCNTLNLDHGDIDVFRRNPGAIEYPYKGWGRDVISPEWECRIALKPTYYFDATSAQINLYIQWQHSIKNMKFLKEPIQPPAGYENVSMEPKIHVPTGPQFPPMPPEEKPQSTSAPVEPAVKIVDTPVVESTKAEPEKLPSAVTKDGRFNWWIVGAGIAALGLGLVAYLRGRNRPRK